MIDIDVAWFGDFNVSTMRIFSLALNLRGTLLVNSPVVQWCTTAHHGIKRLHNHDISIDYVMDHETWPIHDKKI